MLASFEMTTDILYESATHCRKDEITGVSECIIMGNMIPVGTGIFKVMYDETVKGPVKESMVVQQDLVEESLAFDDVQEIIKDKKLIFK
jgi:DNA-directed RNA polymerase III subunit RPC1